MTRTQYLAACRAAHGHLSGCAKSQNAKRIETMEDAVCTRVGELLDLGLSFDMARAVALEEECE